MNSTNKKSPGGQRTSQRFDKPVQLNAVKRPVAPPVYRPPAIPKAVQPKSGNGAATRTPPGAPQIYRPQPVPRVLQKKNSPAQEPQARQNSQRPVVPAVYRPLPKPVGVHAKMNLKGQLIQRAENPGPRLRPEIKEPSAQEWQQHNTKWQYGDKGTGDEDTERNAMKRRGMFAQRLDELSAILKWHTPERDDAGELMRVRSSELNNYFEAAKAFYHGTREQGHEIWVQFQRSLKELLEDAFYAGYAVNRKDIQQALAAAALAKADFESDALGSAGRSNMRR